MQERRKINLALKISNFFGSRILRLNWLGSSQTARPRGISGGADPRGRSLQTQALPLTPTQPARPHSNSAAYPHARLTGSASEHQHP